MTSFGLANLHIGPSQKRKVGDEQARSKQARNTVSFFLFSLFFLFFFFSFFSLPISSSLLSPFVFFFF